MAQKPVFLTRDHIKKYYKIPDERIAEFSQNLREVGFYLRTDNPLYAREDIEKELENE